MTLRHDLETCARAAYEVHRAYMCATGAAVPAPWPLAGDVEHARSIGIAKQILAGDTPSVRHRAWLAERYGAGWKHGPAADATKLEHPSCVPYAELPIERRVRDALYVAAVTATARAIGLRGQGAV